MAKRFRNPCTKFSASQNPERWLPKFATRIAPDFVPNWLHIPSETSQEFQWLAEPFSSEEFETALEQCNNSSPGIDDLKF
jgi:hypothetical protein